MPAIYARWIWEICHRFGNNSHLLILTDQNWTFAPIYRKSTALGQDGRLANLQKKLFGVNGAPA